MKKDIRGILFILAGLAFIVAGYLDGNKSYGGIALMFIILGLVFLKKDKDAQSRK